ncbi:MAG: NAD+ synthase [Gammaproteobacteria bacterium]|nr:MAG: NAD+ synthase [Gammaproteobacteria bacterium]
MPQSLRIALGQLNLMVGAFDANVDTMLALMKRARDEFNADLVAFPELGLTGYPPEDLLLRPGFYTHALGALERMTRAVSGIDVIVGHPWKQDDKHYNAASLLRDGKRIATYRKQCLPNYGVFDEKRYFVEGDSPCVVDVKGLAIGLTICEDMWSPEPVAQAVQAGAKLIININASPFHTGKFTERETVVSQRISENKVPVVYVNLIGGQDELVFDGSSFAMNAGGKTVLRTAAFAEDLGVLNVINGDPPVPESGQVESLYSEEESVYRALVLGVRDYVKKNGFKGVVIGLSGGIDSALTLAIAVDALGSDAVEAVLMPSRYTSDMSIEDAQKQAETLNVLYRNISIEPMYEAFLLALQPEFEGMAADVTEENIQARIRGVILMAISNKTRRMLLTTGNKSEMAVGYATLYGDMAGGFAAIKDVPKILVYRLAAYRNKQSPVIPDRVIMRPPSAELAPDQQDVDSLPPYEVLDPILEAYVEQDLCAGDIIARGFPADVVHRVIQMVDRNEYKRRQAAPGVRITQRAFGRDRRYPVTSAYASKNRET